MGNPAIWWLGILALLFCVWRMTRGPNCGGVLVALVGLGSLVAMIILYQAAVRYHNPNNFNTSYTAAQFRALFHQQPSSQYEIARTSPGFWFVVAFAGMVVFAALVDHFGRDLAAIRARIHRPRVHRVVDHVGARQ